MSLLKRALPLALTTMTNDFSLPNKFIQIDHEGYFHFSEDRVTDNKDGFELFNKLSILETGHIVTECEGQDVLVEAFDEPFVAHSIDKNNTHWTITLPYGFKQKINMFILCYILFYMMQSLCQEKRMDKIYFLLFLELYLKE